jgi:hypothetical protein
MGGKENGLPRESQIIIKNNKKAPHGAVVECARRVWCLKTLTMASHFCSISPLAFFYLIFFLSIPNLCFVEKNVGVWFE